MYILGILLLIFVLNSVFRFITKIPYVESRPDPSSIGISELSHIQYTPSSLIPPNLNWQDRIVIFKPYFEYDSINEDGSQKLVRVLICNGEPVVPISNIARSPDGKTLAFILPSKEEREKNVNWQEKIIKWRYSGRYEQDQPFIFGEVYFFDLTQNNCINTGFIADVVHHQTIAFSPDGKYLAYPYDGLFIYNLQTHQHSGFTIHEGSAHYPEEITGPLVWNQKSTVVYMSVHNVNRDTPGYLAKVDITHLNPRKKANFPDQNGGFYTTDDYLQSDPNEIRLITLPPYKVPQIYNPTLDPPYPWPPQPDDPTQYAISPDETKVVVEEHGNAIIKNVINLTYFKIIYDRKKDFIDEAPFGHPFHFYWTKNNTILFETSCQGCASSAGVTWISRNAQHAKQAVTQMHDISLDSTQSKIIYDHDFFGDYYIPIGKPFPTDFDSTGHRYDSIGIYDLNTDRYNEFWGKDVPYGEIVKWIF